DGQGARRLNRRRERRDERSALGIASAFGRNACKECCEVLGGDTAARAGFEEAHWATSTTTSPPAATMRRPVIGAGMSVPSDADTTPAEPMPTGIQRAVSAAMRAGVEMV